MKVSQCLPHVERSSDCEFLFVTSDTRKVQPGSLFVCIRGEKFDGHQHVEEARQRGAVGIVAQYPVESQRRFI